MSSKARHKNKDLVRTGSRGCLYIVAMSDGGLGNNKAEEGRIPSRSIMVDNDQRDLRLNLEMASLLPRVAQVKIRRIVSVTIKHVRDEITTV